MKTSTSLVVLISFEINESFVCFLKYLVFRLRLCKRILMELQFSLHSMRTTHRWHGHTVVGMLAKKGTKMLVDTVMGSVDLLVGVSARPAMHLILHQRSL